MGLLIKADSLKNVNKIDKLLARLFEGKKKGKWKWLSHVQFLATPKEFSRPE